MIGTRSGRLTVIEPAGHDERGEPLWRCRCDCGGEKTARGWAIRHRRARSCGCIRAEKRQEQNRRAAAAYRAKRASPHQHELRESGVPECALRWARVAWR